MDAITIMSDIITSNKRTSENDFNRVVNMARIIGMLRGALSAYRDGFSDKVSLFTTLDNADYLWDHIEDQISIEEFFLIIKK